MSKKLYEENKEVAMDWVLKNCSEAISKYKKGFVIYKGMSHIGEMVLRTENHTKRKARYATYNLHTSLINEHPMFAEFPSREHVCSTNIDKALRYGHPYVVLPINGSEIGVLPNSDIYYSFLELNDAGTYGYRDLGTFYTSIRDLCVTLFSREIPINTIDDVYVLRDKLHTYYMSLGEQGQEELVGDLHRQFKTHLSGNLVEDILRVMRDGVIDHILGYFAPTHWKVSNISKFDTTGDHEVWMDGNIVLVDADHIDSVIHNEIIEETVLVEKQIQYKEDSGAIIVLAGSPGVGKSYSISNFTNIKDTAVSVDIDEYKRLVLNSPKLRSQLKKWLKTATNDIIYQNLSDIELSDPSIMKDETFNNLIHDFMLLKGYHYKRMDQLGKNSNPNIVIDGTLRYLPSIDKKVKSLYDRGYTPEKTHLLYVYGSLEDALDRNSKRDRVAGEKFIRGAYGDVMSNMLDIIRKKTLPADMTGSFRVIVNRVNTNTSNLKYFTLMKDGVWDNSEIKKFIRLIQNDRK